MNKLIEKINKEQIRTDIPEFRVGDTVKVGVRITEGKKERVFPVNSPTIESVTVIKKGKVRRAKLSFLRGMKKEFKTKERN